MSRDIALAKMVLEMQYMQMSVQALVLHRKDNEGTLFLEKKYPHIIAELEDLTLDWILIPKMFVRSDDMLKAQVPICRENLELGVPALPDGVTPQQYKEIMNKVLDYLEDTVCPLLEKMPAETKQKVDITNDEDYRRVVEELGLTQSPEQENF